MIGMIYTVFRNFMRNLKRYRILLVALVLITAILTIVLAGVLGMREGLYEKASRYFAGNLVVTGYSGTGDSLIQEPQLVLEAVTELEDQGFPVKTYSLRSAYYDLNNIELFFAGYYTQQRRMVGVEWALERPVLQNFDFVSGGVPADGDESAVLISSATAGLLGIGVGDELLVSIRSDRGRTNTADFIVSGIFSESSFFGYQTYLHRRALNRLREAPEDLVNEIGVYLEHPIEEEDAAARALIGALGQSLPVFGIMQTRSDYSDAANKKRDGLEYGVVTIGAQLEEIEDLLGAVTLIAGFAILLFLIIVVVGVSNTFTMIVWERTREIGTLRALGMQRRRAVSSFLAEAGFLGFAGFLGGLLLGIAVLEITRLAFSFPPNIITTLFFTRGRLSWVMPVWSVLAIAALVVGASVLGSLRASMRAGKMSPVTAMSHQTK